MPLPFNKTLDLKLVNSVKENPSLYDARDSKYLDFDAREVVWQKIGDNLGRPASLCKSRWVNIRDMMRRKLRHRQRDPTLRANIYKYKYEDELAFMLPHFKESLNSGEDYAEFLEVDASSVPPELIEDLELHRETKPLIRRRQDDLGSREQDTVFQDFNPADPLDVFLITIGATLRRFSPYYLNQAKSKIFQIVQDFELEQIVSKDCQPGSSDGS